MAARTGSLSVRLLIGTMAVLLVSFALTIAVLDELFQRTSEESIRDLLEIQVLTLIGLAEPGSNGALVLPADLPEARLSSISSGLFAEIVDPVGQRVWRSPSAAGLDLAQGLNVNAGERLFLRRQLANGTDVLVLGIGITWELVGDATYGFQVFVGEDLTAYQRRLAQFRQQLFGWFAAIMCAVLIAVWLLLRWGLSPLRRMASQILAIENGDVDLLREDYPRELAGVARNMNALVRSERQRISRFRTTMDDLAHSLKTPLAVLRSELGGREADAAVLRDQVARMQGVIDYRLRRAAAMGPRTLAPRAVALAPICHEVSSSLRKIHIEKKVAIEINVAPDIGYRAESGDLFELIGNLLDNAWKWCRGQVVIAAVANMPAGVTLTVSDDGPGIPAEDINAVLDRGNRGESKTAHLQRGDVPGQGIGLAVVAEIVSLYGGKITIHRGPAGGAQIEVVLP